MSNHTRARTVSGEIETVDEIHFVIFVLYEKARSKSIGGRKKKKRLNRYFHKYEKDNVLSFTRVVFPGSRESFSRFPSGNVFPKRCCLSFDESDFLSGSTKRFFLSKLFFSLPYIATLFRALQIGKTIGISRARARAYTCIYKGTRPLRVCVRDKSCLSYVPITKCCFFEIFL